MKIDEKDLNKKLRKHTRAYARLKDSLQEEIEKHIARNKPTDLLWLCDKTGLPPSDAAALYQLLFDRIADVDEKKANLCSKNLDSLVLSSDEFIPLSGSYKLKIDPTYIFRVVFVSDTHLGSRYDNVEGLEKMFDYAVSIGAQGIYHSGDLTDGLMKHKDMFIHLRDRAQLFEEQYDYVVNKWPKREGLSTYFIGGNHDHFAWDMVGADICRHIDIARDDMVYLKLKGLAETKSLKSVPDDVLERVLHTRRRATGRVGAIHLGPSHIPPNKRKTLLMMLHPGNGSGQTISYAPQKIVDNLDMLLHAFENMENQKGKRIKPHMLLIGHYHKFDVNLIRNVWTFQAATMKLADPFHEVRNLNNMMGYWAVELTTNRAGDIQRLGYRLMPAYVNKTRATRRATYENS